MDKTVFKYPLGVRSIADEMTRSMAMPSNCWNEMLYWLNRAYERGSTDRDAQTLAYINKMAKSK